MDFKTFLLTYSDFKARFAKYGSNHRRAGQDKNLVVEWRLTVPAYLRADTEVILDTYFPPTMPLYRAKPSPDGLDDDVDGPGYAEHDRWASFTVSKTSGLLMLREAFSRLDVEGQPIMRLHPRWPIFVAWNKCIEVLPSQMQDRVTRKYEGSREVRRVAQYDAVENLHKVTRACGGNNRIRCGPLPAVKPKTTKEPT